jgi:hypothetical protein
MKALLWTGMVASWIEAGNLHDTWLAHAQQTVAVTVAAMLGAAGTILCYAGLEAIRASAQREWREGAGKALPGRHRAGENAGEPSADVLAAAYEDRLTHCEKTMTEVFTLMQMVCDELHVDTRPAGETRPMLRVIPGGEAG